MQLSKLSLMLVFLDESSPCIALLCYSFIRAYSLRTIRCWQCGRTLYDAFGGGLVFLGCEYAVLFAAGTKKAPMLESGAFDHEKYSVFYAKDALVLILSLGTVLSPCWV